MVEPRPETAAEALLLRLADHGITHLLANAGTDFAPLIEGLVRLRATGANVPEALPIAHETCAVAMAHGYWLASGRPLAVGLHTNVGLANAVMGLINGATDEIPMLVLSGRTPILERGRLGARDLPIHWGQEMRDQAGMVRELVKWDYELRFPEQISDLVDRALAIAQTDPMGPVYLSLPREVLCARIDRPLPREPVQRPATACQPTGSAIAEVADILAHAERPLVVAQRSGREAAGMAALVRLAEALAAPVVEHWPVRISFPASHPLHAGFDPHPLVAEADAILVVDALVPWLPQRASPRPGCTIVALGPDPLFKRTPVWGFPVQRALAGDPTATMDALATAVEARTRGERESRAARRDAVARRLGGWREAARARAREGIGAPMTAAWASVCIAEAIGEEGVVFTELGLDPAVVQRDRPGSWFGHAMAGGLGWAVPAALGAQLADRTRLVIAAVGDGSYLFANPVACHQIAAANDLPVLTIVLDNGMWNAVRRSTLAVYPDGHAGRANRMPLTSLEPRPDFAAICAACGGFGRRVRDGRELPAALAEALRVVRTERRQALLQLEVRP
ncbi:MAG: thiamine pyrophosphate-requiring protein [Geminicoccaceae bacterium]|nr:thiamine pyrophosphate-requiring protein [Geminicoccaceae bacterium]MCX8101014.1 thiamine pyrophosphate-requiring protein [Geminicoccaceae bacterium]MDW8370376.1 thiamine pyrophosphate-requiring protein [Geminicoccaceae bacterium]